MFHLVSLLVTMALLSFSPAQAKDFYSDKVPRYAGPNCWNSVLAYADLVSHLRFSSDQEMTLWMSSPFCRKLTSSETPLPHDIISIRTVSGAHGAAFQEIHGMIFLDRDTVFSKNTSHKGSLYEKQGSDLIYQMFRVDQLPCRESSTAKDHCNRWADYYRCHSPQPRIEEYKQQDPRFAQFAKRWTVAESALESVLFSSTGDALAIRTEVQKLRADFSLELQSNSFFWRAAHEALKSAEKQVEIIGL